MHRYAFVVVLLVAALVMFSPARQAFSMESGSAGQLIGKWEITHRPVDAAGKPCPFLPEAMELFKDQFIVMSNFPGMKLPFTTELTSDDMKVLVKRSEVYNGKHLLLIKPNPRMEWRNTPMVYMYSITNKVLSLTVEGWETATYKRVK